METVGGVFARNRGDGGQRLEGFRHLAPAVFDEPAQDGKCFRSERGDLVAMPEPLAGEVQAKVTEREASTRFHRR
jgi:hypothetical protein